MSMILIDLNFVIEDIYYSVNRSLKGKWASLACHETGSLVVQVFIRVYAYASILTMISMLLKTWKNQLKMVSSMNC